MGLPRGELQRAGDQDDHAHRISAAITVTSSTLVFVVSSPPDAGLVAPLRRAIEPLIHAPEAVQSPCIGGIRVIDDAVVESERAHARPLTRVRRRIGSRRRCNHGDWIRTSAQLPRAFAPIVVFDRSVALLLRSEPD